MVPIIGIETLAFAAKAKLHAVAVKPGHTLLLEKAALIARGAREGLTRRSARSRKLSAHVWSGSQAENSRSRNNFPVANEQARVPPTG
jgi:LpxI C-terminal domain